MKKLLLFGLAALLIVSCKTNSKSETDATDPLIELRAKQYADSIVKAAEHEAMFDTSGLYNAPVKIVSAKLVEREYSSYKDMRLSYKNVSDKKIDAIRFRWYGLNAFGEPADMGTSLSRGFGGGFTDDPLSPGRSDYGEWGILSRDGKKVVLAWPTEVVFTDGTKWEIGK